jgi:hypothetical protein
MALNILNARNAMLKSRLKLRRKTPSRQVYHLLVRAGKLAVTVPLEVEDGHPIIGNNFREPNGIEIDLMPTHGRFSRLAGEIAKGS